MYASIIMAAVVLQDPGGLWRQLAPLAGWAALIGGILLLAATERMRRTFVTKEDLPALLAAAATAVKDEVREEQEESIDRLRNALTESLEATKRDLTKTINGWGERLGTFEKLTMGNQDAIAGHARRADLLEEQVRSLREHGSSPSQRVREDITNIMRRLDRMSIHLSYLTGLPADVESPDT